MLHSASLPWLLYEFLIWICIQIRFLSILLFLQVVIKMSRQKIARHELFPLRDYCLESDIEIPTWRKDIGGGTVRWKPHWTVTPTSLCGPCPLRTKYTNTSSWGYNALTIITSDLRTDAKYSRSYLYFSQSSQTATSWALTRQPSVSPPRTGWSPPRPAPTSDWARGRCAAAAGTAVDNKCR